MEIIADLARADAGLEIVGVLENPLDILMKTKELAPDVLVLAQLRDGSEPGICSHCLLEYPNVAILLLPQTPGDRPLWRMILRRENCGTASRIALHHALKLQ